MRFSIIRGGVAAFAAATALAACSGHGIVPSQTLAPGSAGTNSVDVTSNISDAKISPCDLRPKHYYFEGSCSHTFAMNLGATTLVKLGQYTAYKGIKINTTLSKFQNPPKGVKSVPAIMADATGKADILGTVGGKAFPLYVPGQKDCVNTQNKPEICPGKATFVYAMLYNNSKYKLTPIDTPSFYITDSNGFPGKNLCFPAIHTTNGWAPNQTLGGKPNGKTLVIVSARNPGQLIFQPDGQFIVVGVCE